MPREKAKEPQMPRNYSLIKEVKKEPAYKLRGNERDAKARKTLTKECELASKNDLLPGQLVLFEYFEPKTQEELEYYDASPCTIFFGRVNTDDGPRVLGFNIHYYPPTMRYNIMDKIMTMFRPVYAKYYTSGLSRDLDGFDYAYLIQQLSRAKLAFGVRMYIPKLVGKMWKITPKQWPTAMLTEGWFKKETRAQIMSYWKERAVKRAIERTNAKFRAQSKAKRAKK